MFWEATIGTYWPRSNSFEFDDNGDRAPGAKVYFFDAGTSTPRATYANGDLSGIPNAHPVVADGNGRWPQIFLQFGSYKEVATTSGGTTLWETDDIPNPAPTDPAEGVDANAIFQTGDMILVGKNGTRTGFVRCNGRSIGSAASAATERANPDTAPLYAFVWDNYANGQCAVSGGRGATAAADFAANKTIALPDYRGACLTGFDDMGNTAAGLYASAPTITGSGILAGSLMGANTHVILEGQLPVHAHTVSITSGLESQVHSHVVNFTSGAGGAHTPTFNDPGHLHNISYSGANYTLSGTFAVSNLAPTGLAFNINSGSQTTGITMNAVADHTHPVSGNTGNESVTHTHLVSGNTGNIGSGTAHNIMARSAPVTVLMKL